MGGIWGPKSIEKSMKNMIKKVIYFLMIFFNEKWSSNGGPGDLKWRPKWRNFVDFSGSPPGALQVRVWGGFWMDLEAILTGFWTDLEAGGSPNKDKNE